MIRPLLPLAAATALAGCNLAPDHVRPVSAVPATLPEGGVYPSLPSDAPDISTIGWRDFFTDPRLQATLALGLANNRDLRVAAANVLEARARYRVQRANRLPTLGANAGVTVTNNVGAAFGGAGTAPATGAGAGAGGAADGAADGGGLDPGTGSGVGTGVGTIGTSGDTIEIYSVNVGVSAFEVDLFGRVSNLSRAALEQYFATEEAQRATRISLLAEIASAWLRLAADQDRLAIVQDTLDSFQRSLDLTRAQFRIGVISELEVRQSETLYQVARNDIAALRTQIAQDRNLLNLLVGTAVSADLAPDGLSRGDVTLAALPVGVSSAVLLRRPDVLQAEHQLIAQAANIGAARAALFPTISLTATLGTISTALSGLFDGGSGNFTVAPAATLPIFDFGRRRANIELAEASQLAALATYERTLQTAFREVADQLAVRGTIDEQLDARTRRVEAADTDRKSVV